MRIRFAVVLLILPVVALAGDTWKLPLIEKDRIIEEGIVARHNILGLYPSMVQIPPEGQEFDVTTTNPFSDVVHAVCWTANHLAGASFRYAFLKKTGAPADQIAAAKKRADELFEAVYRCQRITGTRGLQARGYFLGHGEVYDERHPSGKIDDWHQGEADGQEFRWVADPSHHNYSDAIHGLGQYYDLAAEGEQKDRCRDAIDALVSYWVDNNLTIYNYGGGRPVPILGFTDGKTLNTRVMMAIAGAKVAYHATGNPKFKEVYDRLLDQYGVRGLKDFKTEKDFDDAEHVLCHLENLFRIEDDPELLAAYRKVADGIWATHVDDAQSLFTYIYYGIAPDAPDREKALQDALYSLQTWPTDMTIQPRMNSIRKDAKPPYPVYAAAWDNEYIWKGNLLRGDGWLSRIVVDVAASPEDPMVLYAIDQNGDLYQSRDGAATAANWHPIDAELPSPAKAVAAGQRSRILLVAAADGFYLTRYAGTSWERLPVPANGTPVDIVIDPANPNVLYAVTTKSVYRSPDFGEKFLGKTWESLTDNLPAADTAQFTLALDESRAEGQAGERRDRIYALLDGTLFTRRLTEAAWTQGARIGYGEYTLAYPWFVADPTNPDHVIVGLRSQFGGMGTNSLLQQSTDAGATWSNSLESIYKKFADGGMMGVMSLFIRGEITAPIARPDGTLITGSDRGVLTSTDGGASWQEQKTGLDIPVARSMLAPRHCDWLFAGTPAGLYVSKDGGETWEDGHLVLQFTKNTRRELGGASFVDAFWRGRWYGFIDDATATAAFDGE